MNKACYTCLIGNYEELKEPAIVSPGWDYICFTDQNIHSNVWQIVKVKPQLSPQRTARKIKLLPHKFLPCYQYTLWVDCSFQINVDLNNFWAKYFRSPFSCPAHPIRHDVFQEIESCISNKRGDPRELAVQREAYNGLVPRFNGVITSGLLFREKTEICNRLCDDWWDELSKYSTRDQVAFAKIKLNYKFNKDFHHFIWDYSQSKELKHIKHYHLRH